MWFPQYVFITAASTVKVAAVEEMSMEMWKMKEKRTETETAAVL